MAKTMRTIKTQLTQNELDEMRNNPNNYKWKFFISIQKTLDS